MPAAKRPRDDAGEATDVKLSKRARKQLQKRGGDASHIVTKAERAAALRVDDMTKTRASGAREARAAKAARAATPWSSASSCSTPLARRGAGAGRRRWSTR
jgi:hypothetical protein